MSNKRVLNYALVKAMYDAGYDYIKCLVPMLVQVLPSYEWVDALRVREDLKKVICLPVLVVERLLEQAVKMDYAETDKKAGTYRLKKGAECQFLVPVKEASRRIADLHKDLRLYFRENRVLPDESIETLITAYVDAAGFDLDFLLPSGDRRCASIMVEQNCLALISRYLSDPKTQPQNRQTFCEIVMGSILSESLKWTDLERVDTASFRNCRVILDTNFAFSLLRYHADYVNEPAFELYESLLNRANFKVAVFDFTLEQMQRVLRAYNPDEVSLDATNIPSIHRVLRARGLNKLRVEEEASHLGERLKELGIGILETGIDLGGDNCGDRPEVLEAIARFGPDLKKMKSQSLPYGIRHDLAVIPLIREHRGYHTVSINDLRAVFLTSDRKLAHFCQLNVTSKGDIPEIVLDTALASMLWVVIKDRDLSLSPEFIVAAYSRSIFVHGLVWKAFITTLRQMVDDKKIEPDRLPHTFYTNIQDMLCEFSDNEANKVNEAFIKDQVAAATRRSDELIEKLKGLETHMADSGEKILGLEGKVDRLTREQSEAHQSLTKVKRGRAIWAAVAIVAIVLLLVVVLNAAVHLND